jgi:hypothetical protein
MGHAINGIAAVFRCLVDTLYIALPFPPEGGLTKRENFRRLRFDTYTQLSREGQKLTRFPAGELPDFGGSWRHRDFLKMG